MTNADRHLLGTGIYSFSEAAKLIGVRPQRVRAWFRGWPGRQRPVFQSSFADNTAGACVIGFLNLVESLVASQLREHGVSLPTVRRAHHQLADLLENAHPFAHHGLLTDGKNVFVRVATEVGDTQAIEAINRQHVFEVVILPYLQQIEYSGKSNLAELWRISEGVVIDPRRRFGKPIVDQCGISTSILHASYQANQKNRALVADWFGVDPQDVEVAVAFETRFNRRSAACKRKSISSLTSTFPSDLRGCSTPTTPKTRSALRRTIAGFRTIRPTPRSSESSPGTFPVRYSSQPIGPCEGGHTSDWRWPKAA